MRRISKERQTSLEKVVQESKSVPVSAPQNEQDKNISVYVEPSTKFYSGDICPACNRNMNSVKPFIDFCSGCKLVSEPHLHKRCYGCKYSWMAQCAQKLDK